MFPPLEHSTAQRSRSATGTSTSNTAQKKILGRKACAWASTMAQWLRRLPPSLTTCVWFPGPTWWKEGTNSCSSPLTSEDMLWHAHVCANPSTREEKYMEAVWYGVVLYRVDCGL